MPGTGFSTECVVTTFLQTSSWQGHGKIPTLQMRKMRPRNADSPVKVIRLGKDTAKSETGSSVPTPLTGKDSKVQGVVVRCPRSHD